MITFANQTSSDRDTMQTLGFIGVPEILIILLIVLLLFGGRKIPELLRGLGKGVREYRKAVSSTDEEPHADEPRGTQENSDNTGVMEGKA
jgi:sec-independent protein translocase protein TatA